MMKAMTNNRVLLGMSGGVDSSSAAVILSQMGYEVIGATFIHTDVDTMKTSIENAKRVCNLLGIQHLVMDFRRAFQEEVVEAFCREYEQGRTPNPCVTCNKKIKYQKMLQMADELGIHYISSGQYARVEIDERDHQYVIKKAKNLKKDQSYYLYNFQQNDLSRLLLPLGNIESKEETRKILSDLHIDFLEKKESQDICFIKDDHHIAFLEQYINPKDKVGNFVDSEGTILGPHEGIHKYTIGQRKGLKIALGEPRYVISINPENNQITLGPKEQLYRKECLVSQYHIINPLFPIHGADLSCKIRYSSKETLAIISLTKNHLKIEFKEPVKAITPGQSLVFYDGDTLIGGGIISL
jgi:tRNA-uridine 2-sulfurtransferase